MDAHSIYLHIPFCRSRCAYCDFNTYAGLNHLIEPYIHALCQEITMVAQAAPSTIPVHTVFFGGGTPSLLSPAQIDLVLNTISVNFNLLPAAEISLEANPGTTTAAKLGAFRAAGINRLSLGMQSANPHELHLLERTHSVPDLLEAIRAARKAGFDNLNLDLIFGLPDQSLADWEQNLEFALQLAPEHFSIYSLIVEPDTPMYTWVERGLMPAADDDAAADMFIHTIARLKDAGYTHYEVSNFALSPGLECQHNLQYWRNRPYFGFGAGAHGYVKDTRTANARFPADYISRIRSGESHLYPVSAAMVDATPIDHRTAQEETLMVGLRLLEEGVSAAAFEARFGESLEGVFGDEITKLVSSGLLSWQGDTAVRHLVLTPQGLMFGNQVFAEFIS